MDGGVLAGRFRANGNSKGNPLRGNGQEETSAVEVLGQHFGPLARRKLRRKLKWDLVKRVICREKVLIQLESLILAQSERWRQA